MSLGSQPSISVGSFSFCLSTIALDTSALSRKYLANDVLYCFLKLPSHPFDPWNVCTFSCSANKTAYPCSISPVKRRYLETASLNHSEVNLFISSLSLARRRRFLEEGWLLLKPLFISTFRFKMFWIWVLPHNKSFCDVTGSYRRTFPLQRNYFHPFFLWVLNLLFSLLSVPS